LIKNLERGSEAGKPPEIKRALMLGIKKQSSSEQGWGFEKKFDMP
jgi:hypothetical protein